MEMQRFLEIAKERGVDSDKMGELPPNSPLLEKNIGLEKWPVRWGDGMNRNGDEKSVRFGFETALGLGSGIEAQDAGSSISRSEPDASSEDIQNIMSHLQL
ncbi:a0259f05-4065-4140-9594-8900cc66f4e8-CDS [Sclerotinia trifoliorum]|uniref:A0259f05-4065-4140-9594-8900cc66f4e8-CDS n=1 Tax=Sclerotinia trifoliorum TaxID=28548 RepID=A0A8H2ZSA7_9HELO|nr:a0259f05-4065-4140-9594-8900cc66f4e8-CDS [Sclerotinia trifoliorum]